MFLESRLPFLAAMAVLASCTTAIAEVAVERRRAST